MGLERDVAEFEELRLSACTQKAQSEVRFQGQSGKHLLLLALPGLTDAVEKGL